MLQFTPVGEMPAGRMQKHLQSQTSERTKQPALRPSEKPPLAFTALPDFTGAGMHKRRPAPIAAEPAHARETPRLMALRTLIFRPWC
ncbi:hypothetical protein QNH14_14850 [Apirhabdus apintestini]|nr:hypothetical protein QNH14_14850 [Enterobacteriaceae bacterium CA-0114]